mgnify:CR=1 FL=1
MNFNRQNNSVELYLLDFEYFELNDDQNCLFCIKKLKILLEKFAEEIFKHSAALGAFTIPALESVTTDKYPTLAKRPKFSVLNNSYIYEKFGISPSDWKLGIASSLKKLKTF